MYLIFSNSILRVSKSSLYPWLQSSIFLSINTPCHGNSSISVYFTLLIVSWKQCSVTKPSLDYQKNCPNKLNQAPCKICYTENMKTSLKEKTVEKTKLQPGELIHMQFAFYNVTYIRGSISVITIVYSKNILLWVFPIESKPFPVCIMRFIQTTFNN